MTLDVSFKLFFIAVVIGAVRSGTLKSRTCSDGMFRSLGELVTLAHFYYRGSTFCGQGFTCRTM